MKIVNRTHWQTKHLRAIIVKVARREFERDPARIKRLVITIDYNKAGKFHDYVTGRAAYNSNYSSIFVGKHQIDHIDFAHTVAHEFAHNLNVRHREMRGSAWYTRTGRWRELYAWAEHMPIEVKAKKVKPQGVELQMKRYRSVIKRIGGWTTKAKRAATALKKLKQQQARYERTFATKGVPIPEVKK